MSHILTLVFGLSSLVTSLLLPYVKWEQSGYRCVFGGGLRCMPVWAVTWVSKSNAASCTCWLCMMGCSNSWWCKKASKWTWRRATIPINFISLSLYLHPCWVSVGQPALELLSLFLFWTCSCWKNTKHTVNVMEGDTAHSEIWRFNPLVSHYFTAWRVI